MAADVNEERVSLLLRDIDLPALTREELRSMAWRASNAPRPSNTGLGRRRTLVFAAGFVACLAIALPVVAAIVRVVTPPTTIIRGIVAPTPLPTTVGPIHLGKPGPSLLATCGLAAQGLGFAVPCPTIVPASPATLLPPRCIASTIAMVDPEAGGLTCQPGDWYVLDLRFSIPAQAADAQADGYMVVTAVGSGDGGGRLCLEPESTKPIAIEGMSGVSEVVCPKANWGYGAGPWTSIRWSQNGIFYEVTVGTNMDPELEGSLDVMARTLAAGLKLVASTPAAS